MTLWNALSKARDQRDNWREYDRWLNGGGLARHLASDWISS